MNEWMIDIHPMSVEFEVRWSRSAYAGARMLR